MIPPGGECYTSGLLPEIARAGEWFLTSGIQDSDGGVARYFRTDLGRNAPVSTEITGYTASALTYLHRLSGERRYLDAARAAAQFLTTAWDGGGGAMPFETAAPDRAYFFDCGIIVRGLLAVWRATSERALLETAAGIGRHMAADYAAEDGYHPILELPEKRPAARDGLRWSASPGCYQLKSAMGWMDLHCAGAGADFAQRYERALAFALESADGFLPGHPERRRVMDRLHAFAYFLEGLLPRAENDARCRGALAAGIERLAGYLREIAPEFERSDVYAQLLRVRVFADRMGAAPLDRAAAEHEAARLAEFQAPDGGWTFGRAEGEWLPYRNPVSTAFALQALAMCHGAPAAVAELI